MRAAGKSKRCPLRTQPPPVLPGGRVVDRWTRWVLAASARASGRGLAALACGALLGGAATGAGCGRDSKDPAALGAARQGLAGDGQTCVSIQRGTSGAVEDATLWEATPTWNDGADPKVRTGLSGSSSRSRRTSPRGTSPSPRSARMRAERSTW